MLNITIITNNHNLIENLFNEITFNLFDKYRVIKICSISDEVLDCILKDKTNIILLDINMPDLNVINILNIIKKENLKNKLIILAEENQLLIDIIKGNYNVHSFLIKPLEINKLLTILNDLYENSKENSKQNINKVLDELLNNFKFNKSYIGYNYLIESFKICLEKNYSYVPCMKELYSIISEKNSVPNLSIGWNISKAIENMRRHTDEKTINRYFNFPPTPKTFLNTILSILQNKNI